MGQHRLVASLVVGSQVADIVAAVVHMAVVDSRLIHKDLVLMGLGQRVDSYFVASRLRYRVSRRAFETLVLDTLRMVFVQILVFVPFCA